MSLPQISTLTSQQRLRFLNPQQQQRKIIPSSSTAALGCPNGNVQGLAALKHTEVQRDLIDLHIQDVQDGAGFLVSATCGGHERQARPDPLPWDDLPTSRDRSQVLYDLNCIAISCAAKARDILQDSELAIFASVLPSGDCYDGSQQLTGHSNILEKRYQDDHRSQLQAFADSEVDAVLVEAGGVSTVELLAICQLCSELSLPLLISLAVDDEGELLDPHWKLSFADLALRARDILGQDFLGLGLNCNARSATQAALDKDNTQELRLVYPNKSNASAADRARGVFNKLATPAQELAFLRSILEDHPYLCGVGCCCRDERDGQLLQQFQQHFVF